MDIKNFTSNKKLTGRRFSLTVIVDYLIRESRYYIPCNYYCLKIMDVYLVPYDSLLINYVLFQLILKSLDQDKNHTFVECSFKVW